MPGFIDSHVHFGLSIENQMANLARFASERIVRSAVNARNTLMAGVTTARDLGGTDRGVRDSITQGLILGPRIHLAITPLSPTGGHTDFTMPNGMSTMPEMPINPIIDTDDDVRRTIRTLVRSGADVIKVCTTGGVSSPSTHPMTSEFPRSTCGSSSKRQPNVQVSPSLPTLRGPKASRRPSAAASGPLSTGTASTTKESILCSSMERSLCRR